jgi:predicted membrane channel-forming protein YqfA (hemolysin III family)
MKEEMSSSLSSSSLSSMDSNKNKKRKNKKNPKKQLILTREQVSIEFRENYIIKGYRPPNSTLITCLKSVFNINNNEVINFWTHFIPFFLIFIYLIRFSIEYNVFNDNFMWPFFIYLSTASFYLFMSSMAHALNCMSNIARHICFILDYLSISMYGMGCCIAYKAYCLSSMPHYTSIFFDYYVTIAMCVTIVSNICASASRFVLSYNLRGILRLVSVAAQYLFISLPLFYRLITSYYPNSHEYLSTGLKIIFDDNSTSTNQTDVNYESNFYFVAQLAFAVMSAFLYISHIPERFCLGRFDIIGQSHQIFHICSAFATFLQIKALQSDLFKLRPILHNLINNNQTFYQFSSFYTMFNDDTNMTSFLMDSISLNYSETHENLYKETNFVVNRSILNLTDSDQLMPDTTSFSTVNFYTYSIKHIDFLTVTLSPYFRTKLTYAFIMLCCIVFNAMILIYYYLKAVYFNPWNKLNKNEDDFFKNYCNSCCFRDGKKHGKNIKID